MNFIEAVKVGFRNYVNFSRRSIRSEYWYWTLFIIIVVGAFAVIDEILNPGPTMGAFSIINMLVVFALILPTIAVSIRRLHDTDRTGWWVLLGFIPLVGSIVLIYWYCLRGTVGPNRFGTDLTPR